jgi:NADH dehydrogenase
MIVVVGGTGFIGTAIVRELAGRGERVVVMSHAVTAPVIRLGGSTIEVRQGDVRDGPALARALAGADTVIGAAQFHGFPNENGREGLTFENIDHKGTENLVAAALEVGAKSYVYISGAGAAPGARQPWFRAKWGAETAVRHSGLRFAIFRPSWVYGPEDNALNQYVKFIKSALPVVPVIGNGRQRLQPVFVADVAKAVAESVVGDGPASGVYEIGGPEVLSLDEIIRTVERTLGKPKPLVHTPVWLMKVLFSPKALIPALPIPLGSAGLEFATMDAVADNSALLATFPGLRLTPLEDGLNSYLGGTARRPLSPE